MEPLAAGDLGAALASRALAARADQRDHDSVADLEADALADLDDLAGGLVPPDRREMSTPFAVGIRDAAVADRDGVDPDAPRPGRGRRVSVPRS